MSYKEEQEEMFGSAGLDPDPSKEALAAADLRGAAVRSLTEGPCATSRSISVGFLSFAAGQGDNRALASTPLWINMKSLISDTENVCLL